MKEIININDDDLIPDYDARYSLDQDDQLSMEKFIKYILSLIRNSFEYRLMIETFKSKLDIDTCVFYTGYSVKSGLSIQFHHHPFAHKHYVETVIRKQLKGKGYVYEHEVCKEVCEIHYKLHVGLVPLNPTAHQLADSGNLLIHPDLIIGNWKMFYMDYGKYMSENVRFIYEDYVSTTEKLNINDYPDILKPKRIEIKSSVKHTINEKMLDELLISDKILSVNNENINNLLNKETK